MNKVLRIGLVMQGGHYWMGGTEYIKNIISALASLPEDERLTFELSLICSQDFDHSLYASVQSCLDQVYYLKPYTLQNRLRWKLQKTLLKQDDPQLETFLKQNKIDFAYPCLTNVCASAAWIYDFQHKYLPHLFTQQRIRERDRGFTRTAKQASTVVLSSKTAASDFQRFFPESAHKAEVLTFKSCPPDAWFAEDPLSVQHKYALPDQFFIVSNQFWKHKNHLVVFEALRLLQERSIYPIVACTGKLDDPHQSEFAQSIWQRIQELGIGQQLHLLGLIPRIDQIQLMRRSIAVVQPSLFEGWSTVVEDARALGKPILLSDIPVHLEQNPPGSSFFDRCSPENLATLLADCWERLSPGPDLEQEQRARETSAEEIQAFGSRFLKIARGCFDKQQSSSPS